MSAFIEGHPLWFGCDRRSSIEQVVVALGSEASADVTAAAADVLAAAATGVSGSAAGANEEQEVQQMGESVEQVTEQQMGEEQVQEESEQLEVDVLVGVERDQEVGEEAQQGEEKQQEGHENKSKEAEELVAVSGGCMTVADIMMAGLKSKMDWNGKLVQTLPLRFMLATTTLATACQLLVADLSCKNEVAEKDSAGGKMAVYVQQPANEPTVCAS
jgi:hypothetical protein